MKSFSTFAMLAALLMFSALGCTEGTDTGTETTPPASETDPGTGEPGTEPGAEDPGTEE